MGDDRDVGIESGDLQDDLEGEEYTIAATDLLVRYGERRLEFANGSVTRGELLEESSRDTDESADDVHRAVLDAVGDYADGRKDYRDP